MNIEIHNRAVINPAAVMPLNDNLSQANANHTHITRVTYVQRNKTLPVPRVTVPRGTRYPF